MMHQADKSDADGWLFALWLSETMEKCSKILFVYTKVVNNMPYIPKIHIIFTVKTLALHESP